MKYKKELSAGGIVYKKQRVKSKEQKGRVVWLITKHSQFKYWSFPKGLVGDEDPEEEMMDAALREVKEEGGVEAEILEELKMPVKYKYKWEDTLIDKTVQYYLMRYESGDPAEHDWEVEEAKFVPTEEVRGLLTYKNDKEAFEHAVEILRELGEIENC